VISSARCVPAGQRVAQRRVRVDEAGAGQVQAHELHQHLVGVGSAVEGAGAGAVVAGHLGRHQRVAADLSGGELLADLDFSSFGRPRGHGSGRQEDRGDMPEGRRRDDQPRHDLVADAQIDRGVETVVLIATPAASAITSRENSDSSIPGWP
jgi:hypothetical protein